MTKFIDRAFVAALLTVVAPTTHSFAADGPRKTTLAAREIPYRCSEVKNPWVEAVDCRGIGFKEERWRVAMATILKAASSIESMKVVGSKKGAKTVSDASLIIRGESWIHLKRKNYQGWVRRIVRSRTR
ncbi:hypothetical protein [Sphingomonas endolithica]|uniref:hypothetical protein n=1 Tax=Sphingomonas endolithica TaxID=2972485 RepID=UPI0021AEDAAF|nr:hypothetical protein [Sphingomonas sp. ZFBP2030]